MNEFLLLLLICAIIFGLLHEWKRDGKKVVYFLKEDFLDGIPSMSVGLAAFFTILLFVVIDYQYIFRVILIDIVLLIIAYLSRKYFKNNPTKYYPCPYCNKSMKVYVDWKCDKCHNHQGRERSVKDKCVHCKRSLREIYCEYCHEEVKI